MVKSNFLARASVSSIACSVETASVTMSEMCQFAESFVLSEKPLRGDPSFPKGFPVRTDAVDRLANRFGILSSHGNEFGYWMAMFGDGETFSFLNPLQQLG